MIFSLVDNNFLCWIQCAFRSDNVVESHSGWFKITAHAINCLQAWKKRKTAEAVNRFNLINTIAVKRRSEKRESKSSKTSRSRVFTVRAHSLHANKIIHRRRNIVHEEKYGRRNSEESSYFISCTHTNRIEKMEASKNNSWFFGFSTKLIHINIMDSNEVWIHDKHFSSFSLTFVIYLFESITNHGFLHHTLTKSSLRFIFVANFMIWQTETEKKCKI